MANFTRVRPLGWNLYDLLASALMNALDTDHAKAINGDDGSSHAPGTQIVIAGAGMAFGGPVAFQTGSDPHVASGVGMHFDNGSQLTGGTRRRPGRSAIQRLSAAERSPGAAL